MLKTKRLITALLLTVVSAASHALAPIQSWTTNNGARVLFLPAPELPIVDVRVVFRGGSARDGDKPGLASMTNSMLVEGAGDMSATEISERIDGVGAQMSNGAARDMAWLNLRSLSDTSALNQAADTACQVLTKPSFDATMLEQDRQRTLVGLKSQQQSASSIAEKAFYKAIYGSHPYASPVLGTEASVKALSREDLITFHQRYYVGRNATLAIVGALDRTAAEKLAEKIIGELPAGKKAAALPAPASLQSATRETIQHPSAQSHLLLGQPGLRRGDPDYIALYVGNHILGGAGLVSRLSNEVREKRGLSYSAYSYFSPMATFGPFKAGLQTKNEQLLEAEKVTRETLQRFVDEGPTDEELKRSKQNITGGFALRIDSNKKQIEYLAMIGFYNLPLDYLETFTDKVDAVSREQIQQAFQRRLQVNKLAAVVVGQSEK